MTAGDTPPVALSADAYAAWCAQLQRLLAVDDVDGALAAGLMRFPAATPASTASSIQPADAEAAAMAAVADARYRLQQAWAARDRYRARAARLLRRETARAQRRGQPMPPALDSSDAPADGGQPATGGSQAAMASPTLPPAAAAALARAKARAAGLT